MPIPYNESAIPGRHVVTFRVRDYAKGFPTRTVDVLATPEEIQAFVRDGYLIREGLISADTLETLRAAFDEIVPQDRSPEKSSGRSFGGIFLRHMMDKHPAFLEFLKFPPALSVARALFGPWVQVRGFTGRVCYPDDPYAETEWHFHQRLIPDPLPPMLCRPQTMDVLLYLDDLNDANGPLCVVPGSHHWIETDLQARDFGAKPEQVVFRLPAGSAVFAHGALWHRSMPTQPNSTIRRLLLWGYGPCWMQPSIYGVKPENGLTRRLLEDSRVDEETRELLGVDGFM